MARIRTIKPDFWESENLGSQTSEARLLFVGLISLADDEGRGRGEPRFLLGRLHAYSTDVTIESLKKSIGQLEAVSLVRFYSVPAGTFYELPGFSEHQKINRPSPGRNPGPDSDTGPMFTIQGVLTESSVSPQKHSVRDQGKERKGSGKGKESALLPADRPGESSSPSGSGNGTGSGRSAASAGLGAAFRRSGTGGTAEAGSGPLSDPERLSQFLRNLILHNDEGARVPKLKAKAFKRWIKEADLLLRKDKRSLKEAIAVMRWCQDSEFWRPNILSVAKFREKYTTLKLQYKADELKRNVAAMPACPICDVGRPRDGRQLCENCSHCSRCGGGSDRFYVETRKDRTKRPVCRNCHIKEGKRPGEHPGLSLASGASKKVLEEWKKKTPRKKS